MEDKTIKFDRRKTLSITLHVYYTVEQCFGD